MSLLVFFGEETSARVSVPYWCSPSSPFLTSSICHCPVPWEQCMPRASVLPHVLVHLPWASHLLLQTEYHHPAPDPRYLWHLRNTIVFCAPRKVQMLPRTFCLWLDRYQCVCPMAERQNGDLSQWNEFYLWNRLLGMGGAVLKRRGCRDAVPWVRC